MKALVTGATGFVGSHLAEALRRRGHEVTALARSPGKAEALIEQGVRVVAGDLHDGAALDRAVEGQDVIYHVAGVVAARDEAEFLRANRDGTENAGRRGGARRRAPASCWCRRSPAGGPARRGAPLSGAEPPHPVTAYGRSKLAAEQVVTRSALPWSIVRPPIVYGPRDREVLKLFRLARLGIAPVFGDGAQELSAVHAADLAEALIAVATSPTTIGGTYHACHPEVFTSAELGPGGGRGDGPIRRHDSGSSRAGTSRPLPHRGRCPADPAGYDPHQRQGERVLPAGLDRDPTPLTRDSGWRAAYDLRSGLADTYDWYRKAGWL